MSRVCPRPSVSDGHLSSSIDFASDFKFFRVQNRSKNVERRPKLFCWVRGGDFGLAPFFSSRNDTDPAGDILAKSIPDNLAMTNDLTSDFCSRVY